MSIPLNSVSIEDFYNVSICPAKLYFKLQGIKLPYTPPKTKRKIDSTVIGQKGEKRLFEAVSGEIKSKIDSKKLEITEHEDGELLLSRRGAAFIDDCLHNRLSIKRSLEIYFSQINSLKNHAKTLFVKKTPKKDEFLENLKRKHKLSEIIPKVKFYNVSHHYEGEIDFLGITKTGETKIIEVKNTKSLSLKRYQLQLSLYLDGMNKRYIANASDLLTEMNLPEVKWNLLTKLNIPDFKSSIKVDLWDYILHSLLDSDPNLINRKLQNDFFYILLRRLNTPESRVFKEINRFYAWRPLKNALSKKEEQFQRFIEKETLYHSIMDTFRDLKKQNREDSSLKEPLEEILTSVQNYLDQDPDSGVLVYTKREQEYEITETTVDIDQLGKQIWDVKRSVFVGDSYSIKNKEACSRCQYYVYCSDLQKKDEIHEKLKSPIVLVDQGIEKVMKNKSLDFSSIDNVNQAYQRLKENQGFVPEEIEIWKNPELVVKRTPSFKKYFLAKRADKFGKELKYWY